jgi:hypothetical protein
MKHGRGKAVATPPAGPTRDIPSSSFILDNTTTVLPETEVQAVSTIIDCLLYPCTSFLSTTLSFPCSLWRTLFLLSASLTVYNGQMHPPRPL